MQITTDSLNLPSSVPVVVTPVVKELIIMRGLPWCGKSTRAAELKGENGLVYSTDEYFYIVRHPDEPTKYSYHPHFLGDAHRWNQRRAERAIEMGYTPIIIDNTNTTASEPKHYVEYAIPQDYEVRIEEPTSDRWLEIRDLLLDKRSNSDKLKEWAEKLAEGSKLTHGVPAWAIQRMMWRWQNYTVEDILVAPALNA